MAFEINRHDCGPCKSTSIKADETQDLLVTLTHEMDTIGHVSEVHLAENVLSVGVCVPVSKAMFANDLQNYAQLMFWRFWE